MAQFLLRVPDLRLLLPAVTRIAVPSIHSNCVFHEKRGSWRGGQLTVLFIGPLADSSPCLPHILI